MKIVLLVIASAALAGCAPTIKMSTPRSVVVHAGGLAKAAKTAEAECSKHGRMARFHQERPAFVFTFDCTE